MAAVKQRIPWESWLQRDGVVLGSCRYSKVDVHFPAFGHFQTFRLHIWCDHQLPRVSSISQTEISVVDKVEKVRLAEGNT